MGTTICALSDAAAMPVQGFLKKFPEEIAAHLKPERERQLSAGREVTPREV